MVHPFFPSSRFQITSFRGFVWIDLRERAPLKTCHSFISVSFLLLVVTGGFLSPPFFFFFFQTPFSFLHLSSPVESSILDGRDTHIRLCSFLLFLYIPYFFLLEARTPRPGIASVVRNFGSRRFNLVDYLNLLLAPSSFLWFDTHS